MKLTIGEFLARIRKERGYTQREVAEKLGISNRTLSAWEQGRAYPDILTLSQLADLYGVTADEILKGERKEGAEPVQEEGAEPRSSGNITGSIAENHENNGEINGDFTAKDCREAADKFSLRSKIFVAVHCCGALLLCMGVVSVFFILWLGILLIVLGACAVIVSSCLFGAFSDATLKAIGVRPYAKDKVLTAEQNRYALSVGKSSMVACLICGAVWGVFAVLIVILSHGMSFFVYLFPLLVGLLLVVGAAVGSSSDIKKYGSEAQRSVHSANCTLLKKCLGFTAIPVVLAVGVIIFFAVWRHTQRFVDFKGQRDDMVAFMQTAVVTDGDRKEEYALDFSQVTTVGEPVRVHDKFYAIRTGEASIDLFTNESGLYLGTAFLAKIDGSDLTVFNVRYGCVSVEYSNVVRTVALTAQDDEYTVIRKETTDYSSDGAATGGVMIACSVAVCTIVFTIKRKRLPEN